ncbi:MAG: type II toxin-antitoxin system VapC family toxin [Candidatus Lokiarchaeota archaeon]|nr:type II toxin-antitoxin system VapC family toxin [Candidatus Lokiarchaeota archaeon]
MDSSFFLAFCHPADEHHEAAFQQFDNIINGTFGLVYTSMYVVAETATIFLVRTNNNMMLIDDFSSLLYGPDKICIVLPWNEELDAKAWDLFRSANKKAKSKKEWLSFIDCTIIRYCQERQIVTIASFDGHFEPFLERF